MGKHVLYLYRDFRNLFWARLVSSIGDKFYTIALAWYVLSLDGETDDRIHLGLLMAVNLIPVILFGPVIGTFTDRWNKKTCMIVSDLTRALLVGLLTFFMWSGQLSMPLLYILSFLQALCVPLFDTSVQSSLSLLTNQEHTPQAVSLNASVNQVSAVLGALLGSILIHKTGIAGAFLFNACSYIVSAVFISRIGTSLRASVTPKSVLKEFKSGLNYLASNRPVYTLLSLFGLLNLFVAPLLLLLPILVKDDLHKNAASLALLEAALAAGSLAMSVYLSYKPVRKYIYPFLFASALLLGIHVALLGIFPGIGSGMIFLTVVGLMLALTNTIAMSLFQAEVPQEIKGRFFAVLYTIVFAVMPLSYSIVGFVSSAVSTYQLLIICGGAVTLLSFLFLMLPRIGMR